MSGALVWWIHCPRAGYCMPVRVPAVVAKIGKARVTIWAATRFREPWAKRVSVKPESLRPREPSEPWKGAA